MGWRGPRYPGEFPTLGYQVAELIQARCVVPDGDFAGTPYVLTDEMLRFLLWYYRVDPASGRLWFARGGQLVRPQKWGKGPFAAAVICAEADPEGPVRPAGWDARGEPVGRPWATPLVQVTAVSEPQTGNVWDALLPMIEHGPLHADIPDTGLTRIFLPGGGKIEPVTSAGDSRLGQRITFCVQDETHAWASRNGGHHLADTQRRNVAGMGGRFLETSNAWDPRERSVAQATWESKAPGVHKDLSSAGPGSVRNRRDRRRMLRRLYRQCWWVDLGRIEQEMVALLERDPRQAERYFLNRVRPSAGAAFDLGRWQRQARAGLVPGDGRLITVGVDGARFDDALAIVATDVESGHQWPVGIWEVPEWAPPDYEHPDHEVDAAMAEAFRRWDVWRAYCDPQYIEHLVDRWQGRWGEHKVIRWYTARPRPVGHAVRAYADAVAAGDLTHAGDPTLTLHVGNAVRRQLPGTFDQDRRPLWTLSKDAPGSKRKIDGAMAAVLSWEARGDAVAAGALARRRSVYEDQDLFVL